MGVQNFKNLQFYMERNVYFHIKYRTPIILRHLHILNYRQRIKKSIYSHKLEINSFLKKAWSLWFINYLAVQDETQVQFYFN